MKRKQNTLIRYLPVYGCIATGIIYGAIGIIAILSFLKVRHGGADETRLMAILNQFVWGKVLIVIILAGSLSYIIWRFYETFTDPYHYGKDASGLAKRTGISLSTVADILIVFSAFKFLLGIGNLDEADQLGQQREMVGNFMQKTWGIKAVITIGVIYIFTALVQLIYGVTRGYRERLEVEEFKPLPRKLVHFLGITGYFARGIILGITGFFYIKAGLSADPGLVVDTDKAFDFIGDNIGHAAFIIVAAGTIFYGIFMFVLGIAYDIDRD